VVPATAWLEHRQSLWARHTSKGQSFSEKPASSSYGIGWHPGSAWATECPEGPDAPLFLATKLEATSLLRARGEVHQWGR